MELKIDELKSIFELNIGYILSEGLNSPRLAFESVKEFISLYKTEFKKAKELLKCQLGLRKCNLKIMEAENKLYARFKTKIYINGEAIDHFEIDLDKGEIVLKRGKGKSYYYSLIYATAVSLRKLRRDYDIAIGKVLYRDKSELAIRDIYFDGYYTEIDKLKKLIKEGNLRKFPIWQLLYFRPKWLFEVSEGILLYYLSDLKIEDRKIIEEYYLNINKEELTESERYILEAIENRGNVNIEFHCERDKDWIKIEFDEEFLDKLRREVKLKGLDIVPTKVLKIPKWKFEDYKRYAKEKTDIEKAIELFALKDRYSERNRLRAEILRGNLIKREISKTFLEV